ncbi:MAG TPA: cbb3-type cytochrome c oxidase subunit I [Gemmatimonadaceae bacterium]|jgi:cytochrome c oxidase cbb3-type subunit 1|nr:cbb3-type cytochrome c oxidase subunit I [Gemmatimonadaceae bacterium]
MDWFAKMFIRASLIWFVLGITLGLAMAVHPAWVVYRPAHAHMNLVGFVTMMIFGVGYQMLPRFFGHPIHSRNFADAHIWLANVGLAGLVAGFLLAPSIGARSIPVTAAGGILWAIGAYGFVYNMWRTFDAAERRRRLNEQRPDSGKLPTSD